jgi:hypothetical protein
LTMFGVIPSSPCKPHVHSIEQVYSNRLVYTSQYRTCRTLNSKLTVAAAHYVNDSRDLKALG